MPAIRSCPFCSKSQVRRSRRKDFVEKAFCAVMGLRPFGCEYCDERFFVKATPEQDKLIREDKVA